MVFFLCLCDDTICLMAESSSQVAVLLQHLFRRMDFLTVARAMSSYLRRACALSTDLVQVFSDLDTTRARCLQILLRMTFDLGLTMLAAFDLIAKALQLHCKL